MARESILLINSIVISVMIEIEDDYNSQLGQSVLSLSVTCVADTVKCSSLQDLVIPASSFRDSSADYCTSYPSDSVGRTSLNPLIRP